MEAAEVPFLAHGNKVDNLGWRLGHRTGNPGRPEIMMKMMIRMIMMMMMTVSGFYYIWALYMGMSLGRANHHFHHRFSFVFGNQGKGEQLEPQCHPVVKKLIFSWRCRPKDLCKPFPSGPKDQ